MYKAGLGILLIILFTVLAPSLAGMVYGIEYGAQNVIVVPEDYPTIQEAVDAAGPGTVIVVNNGVYGDVGISGKQDLRIIGDGDVIVDSISIESSSNIVVENLVVDVNTSGYTIALSISDSSNVTVDSTVIKVYSTSASMAVYVYRSENVVVSGSSISYYGSNAIRGILISDSDNVTVSGNIIRGFYTAIQIESFNTYIVNNTIVDVYTGIGSWNVGDNFVVKNNYIEARGTGITLSNNALIYGNHLKSSTGIALQPTSNAKILWNIIEWNGVERGDGIRFLSYGGYIEVEIVGNTINYTDNYAMKKYGSSPVIGVAYLNIIYGNIDTSLTSIRWYSPVPLNYSIGGQRYSGYLGNYWASYKGRDTDNDGVGNEPYWDDQYPIAPNIVSDLEFDGPDRVVIHLRNETLLVENHSVGNLSLMGRVKFIVLINGEEHELQYPARSTIFMNETSSGFRTVSTAKPVSIVESRTGDNQLWVNITLEEPGILALYVPGNYSVVNVYKNDAPADYVFNEASRTLILGDPVNVSILLLNNAAGDAGGDTGGGEVPPMPEPPILPVIVMSAVLAGILAKKRR